MTNDYDVVIVGARVAGAMTGLHLARAGHRVLIVDRAGPPADTLSTHALRDAELVADAISDSLSASVVETMAGRRSHQLRDRFAVPLLYETSALASYQWDPDDASAIMRRLGRLTDAECAFLTQRTEQRVA